MLLLLAVCSAKPYSSPSHTALKNMMLKDMEDTDDDDDDNSLFPTKEPVNPFFPFDLFPTCPFGCQCYSRVVHCSDLGKDSSQFCFDEYCYSEKVKRIKKKESLNFQNSIQSLQNVCLHFQVEGECSSAAFSPHFQESVKEDCEFEASLGKTETLM